MTNLRIAVNAAHYVLQIDPEISSENRAIVQRVIDLDTDPVPRANSKVHQAVLTMDSIALLKALEAEPWGIDTFDLEGYPPLHLAASLGDLVMLNILLGHGANINSTDLWGHTAISLAIMTSHIHCVRFLVEKGCTLDHRDNWEYTPFHYAVQIDGHASTEIMMLLLQHQPSLIHQRITEGGMILHRMAKRPLYKTFQLLASNLRVLVEAGINLDQENGSGYTHTPLAFAIAYNQTDYARLIIQFGARLDIACISSIRWNILHMTAAWGQGDMSEYFQELPIPAIHAEALSIDGYDPWETFVRHLGPAPKTIFYRKMKDNWDVIAFTQLYKGVRDRNIERNIEALRPALDAVTAREMDKAVRILDSISLEKEGVGRVQDVETFRAIRLQVRERMWEAAQEAIEERIDVLQEEENKSPWQRKIVFGGAEYYSWRQILKRDGWEDFDSTDSSSSDSDDYENDEDDLDSESDSGA
ncbi:ankyrin [Thozetella sp. PMI_491]|nr:ankyrin [Thozetella sp. PMI_491]